jgi:deoxyguanosine kinase
MSKIISVEGCMGAGKTTLVNFLSDELGMEKILEQAYQNPFIDEFYKGANVKLETELTFLLQHYSLMKKARQKDCLVLTDFSIEKDLVFARLNLTQDEFRIFHNVYDFVVDSVGISYMVIFLEVPIEVMFDRVNRRGRSYEANLDPIYCNEYGKRLKSYFERESKSKLLMIDGRDLELVPLNKHIKIIFKEINETIKVAPID